MGRAVDAELPAEIGERIARAGMRLSSPRKAVIAALVAQGGHCSREELAMRVRERGLRASLSTVYRCVRVLVELGIAREIHVGDASRVELHLGREEHDHLVCTRCGGITEFHDERMRALADVIASSRRFARSGRIEIRSTCVACAAS